MDKHNLKAEERGIFGRKVKNLRQAGFIPANIFGKKIQSKSIQVPLKDFKEIYKEAGETGLIELTVGGEKRHVLVHNLQLNPKTDELVHVDFLQVDLKEKVTASVPVELVGESPAEKQSLGTVVQQLNDVDVVALPTDLPDKFEVSIDGLSEVDQAIYVKDLLYDKAKIEIKNDPEAIVAKVEPPQKIVEEIAPTPVEGGGVPEEKTETSEGAPSEQQESSNEDKSS